MLKHNEVNPLTVFGLRRVEHCPPHFTTLQFNVYTSDKIITDWIWEHLTGRFYYGDYFFNNVKGSNSVDMQKRVGFEIPGEASYFSLILDTLQTPSDF
jgi:hypothetical protein